MLVVSINDGVVNATDSDVVPDVPKLTLVISPFDVEVVEVGYPSVCARAHCIGSGNTY